MSESDWAYLVACILQAFPSARPRCAIAIGSWVVERDGSMVRLCVGETHPTVMA